MISTSAVTGRLDRLQEAGLAYRHSHPHDRRFVFVSLTEAGRDLTDSMFSKCRGASRDGTALVGRTTERARGVAPAPTCLLRGGEVMIRTSMPTRRLMSAMMTGERRRQRLVELTSHDGSPISFCDSQFGPIALPLSRM